MSDRRIDFGWMSEGGNGLEQVAQLDAGGGYEFDLFTVWRDLPTGALYYASDAGCSCPSPYENYRSLSDLERVDPNDPHSWRAFEDAAKSWADEGYRDGSKVQFSEFLQFLKDVRNAAGEDFTRHVPVTIHVYELGKDWTGNYQERVWGDPKHRTYERWLAAGDEPELKDDTTRERFVKVEALTEAEAKRKFIEVLESRGLAWFERVVVAE